MKQRLRLQELSEESYEKLSAKLSYLCHQMFDDNSKIRLFVAFSAQDKGRGNAILWLTKYFGLFPVEISAPNGEIDTLEFSEFSNFSGITLILQSLPIIPARDRKQEPTDFSSQYIENGNKPEQTPNLKTLVPILDGIEPNFSQVTFDIITQQINLFSQQLTENKKESSGTVIYLTGFNYTQETSSINNLLHSTFIPWYLFVSEKNEVKRIYRQPELNSFFQSLPEATPLIKDLDSLISDMEKY